MKSYNMNSDALGLIASIAVGAAIGGVISCSAKAMSKQRKPCLKKNVKKALRNVEHYVDNLM